MQSIYHLPSQFIVDNKEYKHGITNNVIFFSRSAPLCSSLFYLVSYTFLPHDSFDQLKFRFPPLLQVGPQNFPFSCFAEQFFLLLDDLDLQSGHFLLSVICCLHKPFSCVISIILKKLYSPQCACVNSLIQISKFIIAALYLA